MKNKILDYLDQIQYLVEREIKLIRENEVKYNSLDEIQEYLIEQLEEEKQEIEEQKNKKQKNRREEQEETEKNKKNRRREEQKNRKKLSVAMAEKTIYYTLYITQGKN